MADDQSGYRSQGRDGKNHRNSRQAIARLEAVSREAAALAGIQVTLLNKNGHIIFRTGPAFSEEAKRAVNQLRLWFFRQLRKHNGTSRPAAPGPVLIQAERDRIWAAVSMKPTVWSKELLLIGPASPDQAEGQLQSICNLICQSFHARTAQISSWLNNDSIAKLPATIKNIRNSTSADLPIQDIGYQYLQIIKKGDLQKADLVEKQFSDKWSKIASRPLRQQKNEALMLAQQAAGAAIEAALDQDIAYGILDDQLRTIEACRSSEEVLHWIQSLYRELTDRVYKQQQEAWTQPVRLCQHYIAKRLYSRITLDDLARYTGHNPSYLSRHFKAETGESLTKYITRKKIEAACELLRDYKKPIQDVSIMLAFSDQAHFTRAFRQFTGTTPLRYSKSDQTDTE